MRDQRSAECASDLRFDAWLAEELDASAQAELVAHVAACARCHARQRRLVQARKRFAASPAAAVPAWLQAESAVVSERVARPSRRWASASSVAAASAVCVALAAAALLMLAPERGWVGERVGERVKGGEYVSFFVKRGEQVQRGARKQHVQPGDKLRFAYTAMAPRYLAIVSIDAADNVSVYYPAASSAAERGIARAERVPPGMEVALPSAIELDAVLGEERVFVLFCEQAQELAPLRAELLGKAHTLQAPPGCSLDQLVLTKEAATP